MRQALTTTMQTMNTGVHRIRIFGMPQAENGPKDVVALPSVTIDIAAARMNGAYKVVMPQKGIVRHVAINTAYGQAILLVQGQFAADGRFVAEDLLRKTLREEDGVLPQHITRIALQHLDAQGLEESGVGQEVARVGQQFIVEVDSLPAEIRNSGGRLDPLRHLLGQGRRRDIKNGAVVAALSHVCVFAGAGIFVIDGATHQHQPVRLGVTSLIIQLVGYLREEQHAHQQAEGERQQLDEAGRAAPAQGLYRIV